MTEGAENRRYCLECGGVVEPGADFCYTCGSRRVIDVDPETNRIILPKGHCPYCGHDNEPDARFCGSCDLTAKDWIIMLATLLPGAFNVFGIGHIILKKYSRAAVYLVISAIILYLRFSLVGTSMSTLILIEIIGLVVYFKQAFEIFAVLYGPREE